MILTSRAALSLVLLAGCGPTGPGACRAASAEVELTSIDVVTVEEPDRALPEGGAVPYFTGFQGSSMAVLRVAYGGRNLPECLSRTLVVRSASSGARLLAWQGGVSTERRGERRLEPEVQIIEPPPGPLVVEIEAYGVTLSRTVVPRGIPQITALDAPASAIVGQPVELLLTLERESPVPIALGVMSNVPTELGDQLLVPSGVAVHAFSLTPDSPGRLSIRLTQRSGFRDVVLSADIDVGTNAVALSLAPDELSITPGETVLVPITRSGAGLSEELLLEAAGAGVEAHARFDPGSELAVLHVVTDAALSDAVTLTLRVSEPRTGEVSLVVRPGAARDPIAGELALNEVLVSDLGADVSCDGVVSALDEQFVEIVNVTSEPLDLSGVTVELEGAAEPGEVLAGIVLEAHEALVVFGGPAGTSSPEPHCRTSADLTRFGDARVTTRALGADASVPGAIVLMSAERAVLAEARWSDDPAASLQRAQDLLAPFAAASDVGFEPHTNFGLRFSPGTDRFGVTHR